MNKICLLLVACGVFTCTYSQQLTATFTGVPSRFDWQRAGFPGDTVPSYSTVVNIMSFGASNTGASSTNAAFTAAVNSLNGAPGVIYFPAGNYLFTATLFLRSNLILRGEGSGNTTLTFNHFADGDLIRASGTAGATTPIAAAVAQYGKQVTVTDPNIASMGNFVKIYQNNESSLINDTWADNSIGQISCLKSKSGNTFTLYTPHRRAIPLSGAPTLQVLNMIKGVGIECLKIKRMDADLVANQTSNIYFNYAAFCWVKGVESDSTNFAHINIMNSTNIEVTGSYFHGSFAYGGGGSAYGVVCHMSTGDCLIENNVFKHLRHAMLLQAGSNGNVYAYNFSFHTRRTEIPTDFGGDIALHGNYPFANLFEGNIVQNPGADLSHGKNGPFNVFFRNRAQLYGLMFTSGSGDSSIVMYNEVTATGALTGNLTTTGANTIASKNYRAKSSGFVGDMENRFTLSNTSTITHFLEPVRPYYFSNDLQPMGYPNAYNAALSIPARDRYVAGGLVTYCSNLSRKDSMMPVNCNPLSIASGGGYDVHDLSETNEFRDNSNCGLIAKIQASGANPASGTIITKTTVDAAVQFYQGRPYVPRHYDIEPLNNAATATGTITLYFTQQDFNSYNAANDPLDPDLPTGPADETGKGNLRITQFHGTGTAPGNYSGSTELIDPDDAAIIWNAATSMWEVSFSVTGFSGFFATGIAAPLPVKLVSFKYSLQEPRKVLLKWVVAEQVDIRRYEVQRSADGRNYSAIGSVTANTFTDFTYEYTDNEPLNGTSYYRLKIVEDNINTYSRILVVSLSSINGGMTIYPVPSANQFTIRITDPSLMNTEATLFTLSGKQLRKIKLHSFEQTIDIRNLPPGVYYLKTYANKAYKILKQ